MLTKDLSAPVHSSQSEVHPHLAGRVAKHLKTSWRPVVPVHTREAFEATEALVQEMECALIFDSGCGTGLSTRLIAAHHPDSLVIGIDKSAARLSRAFPGPLPHREGNILWVRAELAGFWHLSARAGWRLQAHYILYPNPWPKPGQLQRRWHAHPVFPDLLELGGTLELRTNWKTYAEEFALAVELASGFTPTIRVVTETGITTAFERKYRASGHELLVVKMPGLPGVSANPRSSAPAE
jgi:tRNA (guanine-N7-)-methyltransferase